MHERQAETAMRLTIEDGEGRRTQLPLDRDEITIGRDERNTIRLTERNVSRRHARLLRTADHVIIEDLGSYSGTIVNGDRIQGRIELADGDQIEIGDYVLFVEGSLHSETTHPNARLPGASSSTTPASAASATSASGSIDLGTATSRSRGNGSAETTPAVMIAPVGLATTEAPPAEFSTHELTPIDHSPPHVPSSIGATTAVDHEAATQPPWPPGFQHAETAASLPPIESTRELRLSERPRLVCLSAPFTGVSFELKSSVVPFGRAEDGNDLVIDHNSISRSHGWFELENSVWRVRDNDSANGVKVNGTAAKQSPVKFGDMLDLGHLRFRFCSPDDLFVMAPVDLGEMESKRSNTALYATLVVLAVLAGAAGAYVFTNMTPSRATPEPEAIVSDGQRMCDQGRVAIAELRWEEAVKQLTIARELQAECPDLEPNLEKARLERDARVAVDEAEFAESDRKYAQAIQLLQKVPASSRYALEAKTRIDAMRASGIRHFQAVAARHLDQGQFDEARIAADEIARLQPDHPSLSQLRQRIEARKRSPAVKEKDGDESDNGVDKTSAATATAATNGDAKGKASSTVAAKTQSSGAPKGAPTRSLEERQNAAKEKIREAAGLIGTRDYRGAVVVLKEALAEQPGPPYVASIYKALGVSHASLQQPDEAARYYDLYLKARPNAPDRAELEAMLQRYRESKQ